MTDSLHIERCTTCGEAINVLDGGWMQSRETGRYWHTGCLPGCTLEQAVAECGLTNGELEEARADLHRLWKISQPSTD